MTENPSPRLSGYETTWLTKPDLTDEGVKALADKISAIVGSFGGEVVLTEDWGKRRLAYPIRKEGRAHYTYLVYTGRLGVVPEVERNLRIHEHVIRFLTVNLQKEFDVEAFRKRHAELKAAAKRREEEREARMEERREAEGDYGDRRRRPPRDRGGDRPGGIERGERSERNEA